MILVVPCCELMPSEVSLSCFSDEPEIAREHSGLPVTAFEWRHVWNFKDILKIKIKCGASEGAPELSRKPEGRPWWRLCLNRESGRERSLFFRKTIRNHPLRCWISVSCSVCVCVFVYNEGFEQYIRAMNVLI